MIGGPTAALRACLLTNGPTICVPMQALFPAHALHEKSLQGQEGAGPLVSSQEQKRALAYGPADKPIVNGFFGSPMGVRLSVPPKRRQEPLSSMPWKKTNCQLFPGRTGPPLSRPAPPRPLATPRPWYVRVLDSRGRTRFHCARGSMDMMSGVTSG